MANGCTKLPFDLDDQSLAQSDSIVHGESIVAESGKRFDVIDPGSGKVWASCPDLCKEDVDSAVTSSYNAFKVYSKWTPRQRAECLGRWHRLIVAAKEDIAKILVHETGKPLAEGFHEVDYGASFVWWFMGEADRIEGSLVHSSAPGHRSIIIKQPLGVAVALTPWNFPFALTIRKVSCALAAGCTVVVKPSPETPICSLAMAHLALRAGFPPGAVNVLTTSNEGTPEVAEALCVHPLVKKVSLTGSTRVGKIISAICASNIKKSSMELGGNCPCIIFDDVDMDQLGSKLSNHKWRNAGQTCLSPNRVFIQRGVYDKLVQVIVNQASQLKVGHGMAQGTTTGPVRSLRSLERLESMVQDALSKGAKIVHGTGKRMESGPGAHGFFMEPTILVGVTDDMLLNQEEIFGPVLGLSVFDTEDEVVQRANSTSMGLSGYVFTKNVDRLWRLFENLESGMLGMNTSYSGPTEIPFGGVKESGYGKESGKNFAVEEYMTVKSGTFAFEGI